MAEEFLARDEANEVLFVGTEWGVEAQVLPRLGYRLECIAASGIRGKGGGARFTGLLRFLYSYAQSRQILKGFRPDMVLGVGGYASGPLVLASRGLQIPRFVHEQNAIPGMTNKLLARVAERVFISLEESRRFFPPANVLLTGNPLRRAILAQVSQGSSDHWPATADRQIHLLVFGGSLGAHSINLAMAAAAPHLAEWRERLTITHQTGNKDLAEVTAAYQAAGLAAQVVPFIEDMAGAYRVADLIVCRAGATTIAEVTATGKCCIFIPYPHAVDDHQRRNAEALLKDGAGFMLLERELSGERLATEIRELVNQPETLAATGMAARNLARLDAARIIVDEMLKPG